MADTKQLTPSFELAAQSPKLVYDNFTVFTYLLLLPGLLGVLGSSLLTGFITPEGRFVWEQRQQLGVLITLISLFWTAVNIGPSTHFELDVVRHKAQGVGHYYRVGLMDSLRLIGLYVTVGVIVLIGFLLFIVPGILAIRSLLLAPYFMIDKQLTIKQSLRMSHERSKPHGWDIWGVIGVQLFVLLCAAGLAQVPGIGVIISQVLQYSISFLIVLRYKTIPAR